MGKLTEIEGHHQQMVVPSTQKQGRQCPPPLVPSCQLLVTCRSCSSLTSFFVQTNCAPPVVNTSVGGCLAFSHWSQLFAISSLPAVACVCFAPPIQSKHTIACDSNV